MLGKLASLTILALSFSASARAEPLTKKIFTCPYTRTTTVEVSLIWADGEQQNPDVLIEETALGRTREVRRLVRPYTNKDGDDIVIKWSGDAGQYATIAIIKAAGRGYRALVDSRLDDAAPATILAQSNPRLYFCDAVQPIH